MRPVRPVCRAAAGHAGGVGAATSAPTRRDPLRRIADFIAGMTDRYALIEHARLFAVDAGIALAAAFDLPAELR